MSKKSVVYLYNKNILDSDAQIMVFYIGGSTDELLKRFPYATFSSKKAGDIELKGDKSTRRILGIYLNGEDSTPENREGWFKIALTKIATKLKNLKSIDFPGKLPTPLGKGWDVDVLIEEWAFEHQDVRVRILFSDNEPVVAVPIETSCLQDVCKQDVCKQDVCKQDVCKQDDVDQQLHDSMPSALTVKSDDIEYYKWFYDNIDLGVCTSYIKEIMLEKYKNIQHIRYDVQHIEPKIQDEVEQGEHNEFSEHEEDTVVEKYKMNYQNSTLEKFITYYSPDGWDDFFEQQLNIGTIDTISSFLEIESKKYTIYPPMPQIFRAFDIRPDNIKVVLIGQDPYINKNEAMGLCFSVNRGIKVPPSLCNIYKELESDGYTIGDKTCGDLTLWLERGVFLINTALTVREKSSDSHTDRWFPFTKNLMIYLDTHINPSVIMMFGNKAKSYGNFFSDKHLRIETAHPSPFSCDKFFGTKPFSKANQYLIDLGRESIDWSL